jgi:hypothetical protein
MPTLPPFTNQNFMQMCWVVPDLHAAINNWVTRSGVGPFFLFDSVSFANPCYRGQPAAEVNISAAMAQAGEMQIELVCQHDDQPSFWRDVVPKGQSGLHHLALYSTDYERDLAAYTAAGTEVAFSGLMMGNRVCWLDTTSTLGFMVELIEANPVADAVFGQFRTAAAGWDGKEPVRRMG